VREERHARLGKIFLPETEEKGAEGSDVDRRGLGRWHGASDRVKGDALLAQIAERRSGFRDGVVPARAPRDVGEDMQHRPLLHQEQGQREENQRRRTLHRRKDITNGDMGQAYWLAIYFHRSFDTTESNLAAKLHATVAIEGDADLLRACRMRINELLAEEADGTFRELHTDGRLEYEFRVSGGIPFPPFVAASQAFPEVTVEVRWTEQAQGRSGRALIRDGRLQEQSTHADPGAGALAQEVRAHRDGRLRIALACQSWRGIRLGYVITADQHGFLRVEGDEDAFTIVSSDGVEAEWAERWTRANDGTQYEKLAEREAIPGDELRELDAIAREFTREWIWFDESAPEETAVERSRYEAYGVPVAAANLRSEKLRKVLEPDAEGSSFSSFGEDARWIPKLMRGLWLGPDEDELHPK
jgi:hypothetical protein